MVSSNIKDLLTSFSPSSNFFAIASGDGRIKIWDTIKGQLQTEFSNIALPSDPSPMLTEPNQGHLSIDYTCMEWVQLEPKKKEKKKHVGSSLLVMGTGNGDVLAIDVAAGQLKWKVSNCHPGGVSAVASSGCGSYVYTTGVDGMVCQIESLSGSLSSRFRSSTKALSSLAISKDGKVLATAASQLKVFNCTDNKKIQKFSGHSVVVRCMIFSEDGRYILSSAVGERYVAIWRIDGAKKQHASCVLSMEHPAVFLDSKGSDSGDSERTGLYVLAISELGLCYFWYGCSIEELRNNKPTKISLSVESSALKMDKNLAIFAAKFQDILKPASGVMVVAYGSLVKPSFEKLSVQCGTDMCLNTSQDGVLLPVGKFHIPQKGQAIQSKVTTLDRANAEDAILPIPKLFVQGKKRKHDVSNVLENIKNKIPDPVSNNKSETRPADNKADLQRMEEDDISCLEDKLRAVGILGKKDDINSGNMRIRAKGSSDNTLYDGANLLVDANMPAKKIRAHILSMSPSDAYKFLEILVSMWKTRPDTSTNILPWINGILVNHSLFIISQASSAQMLDTLRKMTRSKSAAIQPLLKLSGRVQLIVSQIDRAESFKDQMTLDEEHEDDETDSESEDQYIDEVVYGEEEYESQSGSDDDNER